jgi:hypothetical protein
MRTVSRPYAVERGNVVPDSEITPRVRALLERLSRINYVIDAHRAAIAMQSKRRAEVQAELEALEAKQ